MTEQVTHTASGPHTLREVGADDARSARAGKGRADGPASVGRRTTAVITGRPGHDRRFGTQSGQIWPDVRRGDDHGGIVACATPTGEAA